MENAVDALKSAGALLFFVLAFTLMISLYNQSKSTIDVVMALVDTSNYYQHVGATDANITREVGLETVIPTIYTYINNSDNSVRINIVNSSGQLVQVFDHSIENKVYTIASTTSTSDLTREEPYSTIKNRYYNNDTDALYMFGAPWANQTYNTYIRRINAYIYGLEISIGGGKVDYTSNNLLSISTGIFYESFVEYRTSGKVYWDSSYEESLTLEDGQTKDIITYKVK